jgi:hypothetical protein
LSSPTCQYPLLPEAVTREWRFCVADSVQVLLSWTDVKAHLIVNPSSMCPLSSAPPPSLRMSGCPFCPCQNQQTYFLLTCSLPSPTTLSLIFVCLPSPCAYQDPGLPWETRTMVPYIFLQLLPHLVCHAPWSAAALNWLLGADRVEGTSWNCGLGVWTWQGWGLTQASVPQAHLNPTSTGAAPTAAKAIHEKIPVSV